MLTASETGRVSIRRSVATRLLTLVFSVYVVITVALTGVHLYAEYETTQGMVVRELASMGLTTSQGLATAVYNVDDLQIRSIVQGLAANPLVVGVRVQTEYQGAYVAGVLIPEEPVEPDSWVEAQGERGGLFWHSRPVIYNQDDDHFVIAHLTLLSSRGVVLDKVWRGFMFIVVNAIIKTVALWVIFLWFSSRILSRPLSQLTEAVSRVDLENLDTARVRVDTVGRNELKVLEEAFTSMIERLRQSQHALREAESRYRSIFENVQEGVFQIETEGRLLTANPALAVIFGYPSPSDMKDDIQNGAHKLFARQEQRLSFLARLSESGAVNGFEVRMVRRDGALFWASISAKATMEHGRVALIEGTLSDISAQVAAREELRRAKETAEAASRMKSDFLNTVSHELRTPLTSVLGFARLIQKRLDADVFPNLDLSSPRTVKAVDKARDNLGIIMDEARRLTNLINGVLDLSRLETERSDLQLRPVDAVGVVRKTCRSLEVLALEKGLTLEVDAEEGLPPVVADQDRLTQVVVNLVHNAVKFTPEGTVACRVDRVGNDLRIAVEDSGPGIAPSLREAVFDKFRQLGDMLTDKPSGTGLGLAISREIVDQHGGRIWVQDRPGGKGSVFVVRLPFADEDSEG